MINDHQCGPFTLEELPGSGVTPDTYVWCKGMADWQQAGDVAEICRYYRNRLFDMAHPSQATPATVANDDVDHTIDGEVLTPRAFGFGLPMPEDDIHIYERPQSLVAYAIIATFLCFPLTGIIAIYFTMMAQRYWREATKGEGSGLEASAKSLLNEKDRRHMRRMAHEYTRRGKMWIGITFFMGFIVMAFVAQLL